MQLFKNNKYRQIKLPIIIVLIICTITTTFQSINYTLKNTIILNQQYIDLTYSPKQSYIGAVKNNNKCQFVILHGHTFQQLQTFFLRNKTSCPKTMTFSQNQQLLIVATTDGSLFAFTKQNSKLDQIYNPIQKDWIFVFDNKIFAISLNYNDTQVAVGGNDKNFSLIQLKKPFINNQNKIFGQTQKIYYGQYVQSLKYAKSGDLLVGGKGKYLMQIYFSDTNYGTIHIFEDPYKNTQSTLSVSFSSDQSLILTTGTSTGLASGVLIFNGTSYQSIIKLSAHIVATTYKAFISQNNLFLLGSGLFGVTYWFRNNTQSDWSSHKDIQECTRDFPTLLNKNGGIFICFKNQTILLQFSLCGSNYYYVSKNNTCQKCHQMCKQCYGGYKNQCSTCFTKQYLDYNDNECKKCIVGCLNCANNYTCKQCDVSKNWVLNQKNICKCKDGWYNESQNCLVCNLQCSLCVSKINCTSCKVQKTIIINGKCVCLDETQFINFQSLTCQNCSAHIPYCIRCIDQKSCTSCDSSLNRNLSKNGICQCKNTFYQNQKHQCSPCAIFGCLNCISPEKCINCDEIQHWVVDNQNGKCKCVDRFMAIDNICQKCQNIGCLKCVQKVQKCINCDQARKWILNQKIQTCQCKINTYFDRNISCLNCQVGCIHCLDKNECLQCYPQFSLINESCLCEKGKYKYNMTHCQKCTLTGCLNCQDDKHCNQCFNDYQLNSTQKICTCKNEKSYSNGQKCQFCVQPCLTCKNQLQCKSCIQGYVFNQINYTCQKDNKLFLILGIACGIILLIVVGVLAYICKLKIQKKRKKQLQQSLPPLKRPLPGGGQDYVLIYNNQ